MECALLLSLLLHLLSLIAGDTTLWSQWWSYQGISGPDYWGLLNQQWSLCSKGRHQSPVDVNPRTLVYDPNLRPLRLDRHRVDGVLVNTGHDLTFTFNASYRPQFTIAGGPLSYRYRVHHIKLHFGRMDVIGSEHTVAGRPFPAEVQVYAYNMDLYDNFTQASSAPHGLTALAVFGMVGDEENREFDVLVQGTKETQTVGDKLELAGLSLFGLLPHTDLYMTYEGSMTQPSCMETVTWILLNKPMYITKQQLHTLRQLHSSAVEGSPMLMENNYRPPNPLHRRSIRTNIAPSKQDSNCGFKKTTFYEVNEKYQIH